MTVNEKVKCGQIQPQLAKFMTKSQKFHDQTNLNTAKNGQQGQTEISWPKELVL